MFATLILFLALGALVVIGGTAKNRAVNYLSISLFLVFLFMAFGIPFLVRLTGPLALGTGSYEHARLWRDKLAACNSLDDVRSRSNCGA